MEKSTNPQDGRAVLLQLTPAATAVLPMLNQIEQQFNDHIGTLLSGETIEMLLEHVWPIVENTEGGQALKRRKQHT